MFVLVLYQRAEPLTAMVDDSCGSSPDHSVPPPTPSAECLSDPTHYQG